MRKRLFMFLAVMFFCFFRPVRYSATGSLHASQPTIVDHLCTRLADVPSEWIAAAKSNLHIACGHTSHGSRLITGMTGLAAFINPETVIRYSLAEAGAARLDIYNLSGQKIRSLVDGPKPSGSFESTWDGKNDTGQPLSSGMYFYHLRSGLFEKRMKAILVR